MQPLRYLKSWLEDNANNEHYIFSIHDIRALFPALSDAAFKTLLSRASNAFLIRICRGLYLYGKADPHDGLLLFHIASYLKSNEFNYISLETVLSAHGIISQVQINWITIMTSGRSNIIPCKNYGTIEFVHTVRKPVDVMDELIYDNQCKMWRASVKLAVKDMKITHRNCDLIDWEIVNELI